MVKVDVLAGFCGDLLVIPVVEVEEFVGGRFSPCSLVWPQSCYPPASAF